MEKNRIQAGFTLAETLLAVLILLLVSSIVATGIPVAKNVYDKVVLGANAQVMLSTAVTALREELGTAWNLSVDKNSTPIYVTYYKANTGGLSKVTLLEKEGEKPKIIVFDYISPFDGTGGKYHSLVPDKKSDMYVTYDTVRWVDEEKTGKVIEINGFKVCRNDETNAILTELKSAFRIKIVSENLEKAVE